MPKKYNLPSFLSGIVTQDVYERWLFRKAQTIFEHDYIRDYVKATCKDYKEAIHTAVSRSEGRDAYTGEMLEWTLLSKYNTDESKRYGRKYKQKFVLLPTVDHVGDGFSPTNFKICGWRVNEAKSDLELSEFMSLCKAVIEHHWTETEHPVPGFLQNLEERLLQPDVRRSAQDVSDLLDDEFIEFGSSGQVFNKQQIIEALQQEKLTPSSIADFQSTLLAPGIILTRYRVVRLKISDSQMSASLRCSIWQLQNDQWKMLFHQGTPEKED